MKFHSGRSLKNSNYICRKQGWNGSEDENKIQWTFVGSLFYAIVCITTIGYGDQTPKTDLGKIITILFSIVGIPIMAFVWYNTGIGIVYL